MPKTLPAGLICAMLGAYVMAGTAAAETPLPELTPPAAPAAPRIDGKLDDACWQAAALITNLHIVGQPGAAQGRHRVQIMRDNAWLYVGFRVAQPILDRDPPTFRNHDEDIQLEDNVQVSFDPGTGGKLYYQFLASPINTRADFRLTRARGREREGWNIPWRSAAGRDDAGWSVEMALPLGLLLTEGDPAQARFNAIITTYIVERDLNVAQVGLDRVKSSWAPLHRHFAEPEHFGLLRGLEGARAETPFLPFISKVEVMPYRRDATQLYYEVQADILNLGRPGGRIKLAVSDQPAQSPGRTIAQELEIPAGGAPLAVRLPVPVATFGARAAEVALADDAGEVWQSILLEGGALAALNVFDAYPDRNYYTAEDAARAMCRVRLPGEMMAELTLRAVDGAGRVLARTDAVAPEMALPVPLADLPTGGHSVRLELCDSDGLAVARQEIVIVKRAPHPAGEWKVDQVNRSLLRNGEPFFPFGFVLSANDDWAFKDVAEMGMNTVYHHARNTAANLQEAADAARTYMENAARHGLQVIFYPDRFFLPAELNDDLKDILSAEQFEQLSKITGGKYFRNLTSLRTALVSDAVLKSLPVNVKGQAFFSVYQQQLPVLKTVLNAVQSMPNLMGYNLFDEPNIPGVNQDLAGRHYYNLVHALDGYHPVFVVYNTLWDTGDYRRRATDWCDVLVQDPYWIPAGGRGRPAQERVTHVAAMVARTKRLADSARRVAMTMPQSEYWSGSRKRTLTQGEHRCQTYLALIHGTKGIIYFTYRMHSQISADTIKMLAQEIQTLGPVCLTPELAQTVVYTPGEQDPLNNKFTDIQVALRRHPAGGYVLLCANTADYPVETTFTMPFLGAAVTVKRLFGDDVYAVKDHAFSDRIEAFGTRAYIFKGMGNPQIETGPAPVEIRVAMTAHPELALGEPRADAELDRTEQKNKLPNSSFEQAFIPGWPDYYWPAGTRLMPDERIGAPNSVWGADTNQPCHGKFCLRLGDGGPGRHPQTYILLDLDPALTRQPARFVLSSWMRANRDGVKITKFVPRAKASKSFTLTTQWQRYELPIMMPAGGGMLIIRWYQPGNDVAGDTVWIDAVQLEVGRQATEYEP